MGRGQFAAQRRQIGARIPVDFDRERSVTRGARGREGDSARLGRIVNRVPLGILKHTYDLPDAAVEANLAPHCVAGRIELSGQGGVYQNRVRIGSLQVAAGKNPHTESGEEGRSGGTSLDYARFLPGRLQPERGARHSR